MDLSVESENPNVNVIQVQQLVGKTCKNVEICRNIKQWKTLAHSQNTNSIKQNTSYSRGYGWGVAVMLWVEQLSRLRISCARKVNNYDATWHGIVGYIFQPPAKHARGSKAKKILKKNWVILTTLVYGNLFCVGRLIYKDKTIWYITSSRERVYRNQDSLYI
jgi:hypothetical protein